MNSTEIIQQAIKAKIEKHSASIKKMNDEAIKLATENCSPKILHSKYNANTARIHRLEKDIEHLCCVLKTLRGVEAMIDNIILNGGAE